MLIREIAAAANTTARTIQRDIEAYNKANGTDHSFGLRDDVIDKDLLLHIEDKREVSIFSEPSSSLVANRLNALRKEASNIDNSFSRYAENTEFDHGTYKAHTADISDDNKKLRPITVVKPKKERKERLLKARQPKKSDLQTRISVEWLIKVFSKLELQEISRQILLVFQSYIYALLCTRVLSMINVKSVDVDPNLSIHVPDLWVLWVVGYVVDSGGFVIAKHIRVTDKWDKSANNWIAAFFVFQLVVDLCYLLGVFFPVVEWIGAVAIVCSSSLALMAYARAEIAKNNSPERNAP